MTTVNKAGFPVKYIKKPTGCHTKKGGVGKNADPKFHGPCCGGTRKIGEFNRSMCACGCGSCRMPLALTEEQRTRMTEKNMDAEMLRALHKAEIKYFLEDMSTDEEDDVVKGFGKVVKGAAIRRFVRRSAPASPHGTRMKLSSTSRAIRDRLL